MKDNTVPQPRSQFNSDVTGSLGYVATAVNRIGGLDRKCEMMFTLLPPGSRRAHPRLTPPPIHVAVCFHGVVVMEHRTKTTQEMSIDELSRPFPPEIFIIESIVFVEFV